MILFGEKGSGDVHRVRRSFHSYEDYMKAWMIPAFNETGGVWPEAFGYHAYTNQGPVLSLEAWTTATGENIWPQAQWVKDLGAWYFYCMRPYRHRTIAVNDDRGGVGILMGSWVNLLAARLKDSFCQRDATAVLKGFAGAKTLRPRVGPYGYQHMLHWLLWHDPEVETPDLSQTPTDRFFPGGMGWVSMRSDWSKDATLGVFLWNDWYGGHKQADAGAFQIHRGAELAVDPPDSRRSAKEMHFRYRTKSVAHNVLLVSEPGQRDPDGGQHRPSFPAFGDVVDDSLFDTARPLAFQSTPEYCWTACDLSGAYRPDRNGLERQVVKYVRQVVFLKPDTFVLLDYIKLTKPEYRRAWILHAYNKPQVSGKVKNLDTRTSVCTEGKPFAIAQGNGKLFVKTVFPKANTLTLRA